MSDMKEIAEDLQRDFVSEYGEDAALDILAEHGDAGADIVVRGVAITSLVATGVDEVAARLFAYAPDLVRAYLAEHERAEGAEAARKGAVALFRAMQSTDMRHLTNLSALVGQTLEDGWADTIIRLNDLKEEYDRTYAGASSLLAGLFAVLEVESASVEEIVGRVSGLKAERDRLARIIAVERGDESQAPEGWRWFYDDDFGGLHQARWSRPFVRVQLDHEGDKSNPWHVWRPRSGGVGWSSHPGRDWYPTALEAMEAADTAAGVTCD